MNKPFLKILFSVAGVALLFLNLNVVLSAKLSDGATTTAPLYSASVVDTSSHSSSSSHSSDTSGTGGGDTSHVPSSWGTGNPWNTGQYYYRISKTIQQGTSMVEESTDGGRTWSITGTLLGTGFTASAPTQQGSKLVRTVTFTSNYTIQCCLPGTSGRCDYPEC